MPPSPHEGIQIRLEWVAEVVLLEVRQCSAVGLEGGSQGFKSALPAELAVDVLQCCDRITLQL